MYLSESTKIINSAKSNADWVRVYQENEKYYISGKELLEYMNMSNIFDIDEAVSNIEESNNIYNNIVINLDECDEFQESFIKEESNIICEKSIEDNATTVKQQIDWYHNFLKASKSKAESKDELKERIKLLNECLDKMKKEISDPEKLMTDTMKYGLKAFIPCNSIYRYLKRKDRTALNALLVGLIGNVVSLGTLGTPIMIGYRAFNYKKMVEKCIKETEDAIKYLEGKLKDFK